MYKPPIEIVKIRVPSFCLINPTKADLFHYHGGREKFDWAQFYDDGNFMLSPCSGGAWFSIQLNRVEPMSNEASQAFLVINAAAAALRLGTDAITVRKMCEAPLATHILATKDVYLPAWNER